MIIAVTSTVLFEVADTPTTMRELPTLRVEPVDVWRRRLEFALMKVTLENTDKIVELETATGRVAARVWEGTTANGIACHAYITRIAVAEGDDATEFARDLAEQRKPSAAVAAIPARLII